MDSVWTYDSATTLTMHEGHHVTKHLFLNAPIVIVFIEDSLSVLENFIVPLRNSDHYKWTGSSDCDVWNFGYRIENIFHLKNIIPCCRRRAISHHSLLDISNPGRTPM